MKVVYAYNVGKNIYTFNYLYKVFRSGLRQNDVLFRSGLKHVETR